jgi:hypothetical protein
MGAVRRHYHHLSCGTDMGALAAQFRLGGGNALRHQHLHVGCDPVDDVVGAAQGGWDDVTAITSLQTGGGIRSRLP